MSTTRGKLPKLIKEDDIGDLREWLEDLVTDAGGDVSGCDFGTDEDGDIVQGNVFVEIEDIKYTLSVTRGFTR